LLKQQAYDTVIKTSPNVHSLSFYRKKNPVTYVGYNQVIAERTWQKGKEQNSARLTTITGL